jgi:hypothetical protein
MRMKAMPLSFMTKMEPGLHAVSWRRKATILEYYVLCNL